MFALKLLAILSCLFGIFNVFFPGHHDYKNPFARFAAATASAFVVIPIWMLLQWFIMQAFLY